MTSLFAQLFLALQAQIKTEVPEIRQVDQDLGQLEYYPKEGRPPVSFPCVLIDFDSTSFSDEGDGVQWCDLDTISVRLAFSPFSSAASFAPDISKEKALDFYEVENKLYVALQRFDAGGIVQPMSRRAVQTEKREDPLRVRVMSFVTATEDDGAREYHNKVKVPLQIDSGVEGPIV